MSLLGGARVWWIIFVRNLCHYSDRPGLQAATLKKISKSAMDDSELLNPAVPPCLHVLSAFLAMEPTDSLISLARVCGGGLITESLQHFIWDHIISQSAGKSQVHYVNNFIKKLIINVESDHGVVLDELYEQYAYYMTSVKDDKMMRENSRVLKLISFLFPNDCFKLPSCPKSMKLVVPLECSVNMLEGDTGCSIWPSSLFLSEFILSRPEIFSNKSCFEVGSGVGLVGICLAHVKASKVILTDGDMSTLANMKANLKLNHLSITTDLPEGATQDPTRVKCNFLPWESAPVSELRGFKPDIILGADVIYDPLCLPHLIRVLSVLLNRTNLKVYNADEMHNRDQGNIFHDQSGSHGVDGIQERENYNNTCGAESPHHELKGGPVAYIASVIRNIDTFNHFLALAGQANLAVTDVTEKCKPLNLLPYMQSYNRSTIQLFTVSHTFK